MRGPALLVVAVPLAALLSGCTLLSDEEPFRVAVHSQMREPWTGTVVVSEADGDERFRKTYTITQNSIRTQDYLNELVGEFVFVVESPDWRWEDTQAMGAGKSSWTVTVVQPDRVCYRYSVDGATSEACPEPTPV